MSYRTVQVSLDSQGVLHVVLNRPEVRNAFNPDVMDDLTEAFGVEALKPAVRAVVLKGSGATFCAGGDLNWMKQAVDYSYEENLQDTRKLSQMFALMNECPKPVIGAIQGAAIGGGVGLVSVCDIAIASSETQFSLSEVRLGIVPACIGPFVIAKMGASQARRFFMSAERFKASQAQEVGLIHQVVDQPKDLDQAVHSLLKLILQCSPNALSVAKRLVLDLSWPERRAQFPNYIEYISKTLADLRISAEGQEGVRAFLEKRQPSWISGGVA